MTTFLRFPDEATAKQVLAVYVADDGSWITASHEHALDPVGVVILPGTIDAEGNMLTAPTPLPGWHVNLLGALPEAAQPYVVFPTQPMRVFA